MWKCFYCGSLRKGVKDIDKSIEIVLYDGKIQFLLYLNVIVLQSYSFQLKNEIIQDLS